MDVKVDEEAWSSAQNILGLLFALFFIPVAWFYGRSILNWVFLAVTQVWWSSVCGTKPLVTFKTGSDFCERIVQTCSALREPYHPPLLWGKSGHIQTVLFGSLGRFGVRPIKGQRYNIHLEDGSTLHYDVYEPRSHDRDKDDLNSDTFPNTILVCPGIGNSSDCNYVKTFSSYSVDNGYRVVVFNHLGALKTEKITGKRIFSYGGTGDISAVFDDVSSRYPNTKFIGCGFSMGACILLRFLGEDRERQKRFVCAASVCQGYDPTIATGYMHDWKNFRRLYNFGITRKQVSLIHRHSYALLTSESEQKLDKAIENKSFVTTHRQSEPILFKGESSTIFEISGSQSKDLCNDTMSCKTNGVPSNTLSGNSVKFTCGENEPSDEVQPLKRSQSFPRVTRTHGDYDHNGIALNRDQVCSPEYKKLPWVTSLHDLDEYFTRRVCGFSSPRELYRWTSCIDLMYEIKELPMLFVNSGDDPLVDSVASDVLDVPRKYIEHNSNALLVVTTHGGHLGFFEGGVVIPNEVTWMDRLLVQFAQACGDNPQ